MGSLALRRWSVARSLYEKWGVPFDLLQQLMDLSDGFVQRRAQSEEWTPNNSTPGLHARLIKVFETQLARVHDEETNLDEEKRARALSVLAKTLETIATLGEKITTGSGGCGNYQQGEHQKTGIENSGSQPGTDGTEELDRQLAELVDGLAQGRPLE